MKSKIVIIILIFLAVSLIINLMVFSYVIPRYGIADSYEKFFKISDKYDAQNFQELTMPTIYTDGGLTLSFSNKVHDIKSFDIWKNDVKDSLTEILSINPIQKSNLTISEIMTETKTTHKITKYNMQSFDDDVIIFYELLPLTKSKFDPILIIPGSGNQGAKDLIDEKNHFSDYYYQQALAEKLVDEGFVVFVIENRGWGERTIDSGSHCGGVTAELVYCSGHLFSTQLHNYGYDLFSMQIVDTLYLLDFIKSLEYVDTENISVVGLSLGGNLALYSSILDSDVKNLAIASGLVSYEKTGFSGPHGILKFYDMHDLASSFAPKPLYLSWGENELEPFRYESKTLFSAKKISESYKLLNSDKNLQIIIHDTSFNSGHTYDVDSILAFFNDIKHN